MTGFRLRHAAALCALAFLSGCVGKLLGGGKPAQLYRLDAAATSPAPATSPTPAADRVVLLTPVRFDPAIESDRLLATQGQETSYIAGARWTSPAPVLFEEALRNAVRRSAAGIVLADRRDGLTADRAVQVTVDRFEAHYAIAGAAPTIVIEGEAVLVDLKSRTPIARFEVAAHQQAASNDIAAIVAAFDRATADAVTGTANWLAR